LEINVRIDKRKSELRNISAHVRTNVYINMLDIKELATRRKCESLVTGYTRGATLIRYESAHHTVKQESPGSSPPCPASAHTSKPYGIAIGISTPVMPHAVCSTCLSICPRIAPKSEYPLKLSDLVLIPG